MKGTALTLLFLVGLCAVVNADNADLYFYDQQLLSEEMKALDELEQLVLAGALNREQISITYKFAPTQFESYGQGVNLNEPPLGIPSFVWGFSLSIIGVIIVNAVTDSGKEIMLASLGAFSSAFIVGTYVLIKYVFIPGSRSMMEGLIDGCTLPNIMSN